MIMEYVTGPLLMPYFILQFAIGAITPLPLAVVHDLARHHRQGVGNRRNRVRLPGAVLRVHDALERGHRRSGNLRKPAKGLLSYHLPFWGKEGALDGDPADHGAARPLLYILTRLFPPWVGHSDARPLLSRDGLELPYVARSIEGFFVGRLGRSGRNALST